MSMILEIQKTLSFVFMTKTSIFKDSKLAGSAKLPKADFLGSCSDKNSYTMTMTTTTSYTFLEAY